MEEQMNKELRVLPPFVGFPKVSRLSRDCVVTEKIDGTNAVILITAGGEAIAGSRSRWLVDGRENFGFAAWAKSHEEELRGLGQGIHFGEWWGSGIQRGYGLPKGERRFSLFDVARWADERDTHKYWVLRPECCQVVPVLYSGPFDTAKIDEIMWLLGTVGSAAAPGFTKPEGIVIWHEAAGVRFKKTFGDDGHKVLRGLRA